MTYTADLNGLIAWLETQPPERSYNFIEYTQCVVGRFIAEGLNMEPQPFQAESLIFHAQQPMDHDRSASCKLNYVGCGMNDKGERTFGAALARAEQLRDNAPQYQRYVAEDWTKRPGCEE